MCVGYAHTHNEPLRYNILNKWAHKQGFYGAILLCIASLSSSPVHRACLFALERHSVWSRGCSYAPISVYRLLETIVYLVHVR